MMRHLHRNIHLDEGPMRALRRKSSESEAMKRPSSAGPLTAATGAKLLGAVLIACVLNTPLRAQQPSGPYPYCAQYSDGTSLDCGFSSLAMCEQSVTGVGGVCIDNPGGPGNGPPSSSLFGMGRPAFYAPVPPPPISQDGPASAPAPQIQSLSSDLAIGAGSPPATLGAMNFSGSGASCIALLFRTTCGGS